MSLKPPAKEKLPSIEAKVVVLGTQGVGKTSLVLRHVGNTFSRSVSPTIGASFFTFSMSVNGFRIKLQLWDTAGQERFRSMAPMYYRRANAAIIVYDITRQKTFSDAREWIKELQSKVDSKIALCVVGNKCDLAEQREISREKGEEFAHQLGAMFTETSASSNIGVKEAFMKVAEGVINLFQHNELTPNFLDPSYSTLNSSANTQRMNSAPQHQAQPINHLQQNGRVTVPYGTRSSENQQDGFLQKCCVG